MKRNKKILTILSILFLVISIDQIFKIFSHSSIQNTGIAFGIEQDRNLIILVNILLLFIVISFLFQKNNSIIFLSLILGGGMSNLLDRITKGYVIDYFHIPFFSFPSFNLADVCICFGSLAFFIYEIRKKL